MSPSLSFDNFERILHAWRQQSNTGNDKNECVLCIFAGRPTARVFDHCNTGFRIFVIIFWWIFDVFQWFLHPRREQSNTGNDKNDRVSMHFQRSIAGCVFDHGKTGLRIFSWSFYIGFGRVWDRFCTIFRTRPATHPGSTNSSWSGSKTSILLTFSSVFALAKIEPRPTFRGFPEKWG